MATSFGKFFRESALYLIGLMLTRLVSFLLLPVYTNVFDQTQNGIITLAYALIGFLTIILPYGTDAALLNFYLKDEQERKNYFTNAYFMVLCSNLIILGLVFLAKNNLTPVVLRISNTHVLIWCLAILFLDTLNAMPMMILRAEGRPFTYIAFSLLNVGLMMGLNILLVVHFRMGLAGIFYSNIITSAVLWVGLLPLVLRRINLQALSGKYMRRLLRFGLPFLPSGIFAMTLDLADRWLLEYYTDIESVGLYGVGYKLAAIMLIFVLAFNAAWQPFFLQHRRESNAPAIFAKVTVWAVGGLAFCWLFFSLWMNQIVRIQIAGRHLIGPQFWDGTGITPLIMLAYFFQALYLLQLPGVFILEKTKWEPAFRGFGAGTNIILNILLIPRFGLTGAAVATVLAYFIMVLAIWIYNRKYYPIRYNWGKIGAVVGLTALAYLSTLWNDSGLYRIVATLIGFAGIGGIIIWPLHRTANHSIKK